MVTSTEDVKPGEYHRRTCEFHEYHAAALNPDLVLDPNYWRANFRIGKDTFDYLCETVYNYVVKDETQLRETIPVAKRVAISLWWLAHGGSYHVVGQRFGISSSIVGRITKDFVGALVHLRDNFISWPKTENECRSAIRSFQDLSSLPNVLAAVDGTHVKIIAPENSAVDFFNRKQQYSIACQGVCDGKLKFLSMSAGYPGSVHDSRMLRNSWLFAAANNGEILNTPVFPLNRNLAINPYLVGDAAYPLSKWLMKPFPYSRNLSAQQEAFNLTLSQARVSIERAFGVLKGRWRILLDKVCLEPSLVADVVVACTVLHNMCQDRNEPEENVLDRYMDTSNDDDHFQGVALPHRERSRIRHSLLDYIGETENCQ